MPDGQGIVAAVRDLYRTRLREAIAAARKVEHEIESVRMDLADALEQGSDSVEALGSDVTTVSTSHGPAQHALSDLTFAVIAVEALQRPPVCLRPSTSSDRPPNPPSPGL